VLAIIQQVWSVGNKSGKLEAASIVPPMLTPNYAINLLMPGHSIFLICPLLDISDHKLHLWADNFNSCSW